MLCEGGLKLDSNVAPEHLKISHTHTHSLSLSLISFRFNEFVSWDLLNLDIRSPSLWLPFHRSNTCHCRCPLLSALSFWSKLPDRSRYDVNSSALRARRSQRMKLYRMNGVLPQIATGPFISMEPGMRSERICTMRSCICEARTPIAPCGSMLFVSIKKTLSRGINRYILWEVFIVRRERYWSGWDRRRTRVT